MAAFVKYGFPVYCIVITTLSNVTRTIEINPLT